jgi:hypothetical protein
VIGSGAGGTIARRCVTRCSACVSTVGNTRLHWTAARSRSEEATAALAEEPTAWAALRRFCTAVVRRRLVALLPIAGPRLVRDARFDAVRAALVTELGELLGAARAEGSLRSDVQAGDLVLTLAAVLRPLPGLPGPLVAAMQARHLGLVLDGLRAAGATALPGAAISADEITARLTDG